MSVTDDPLKRFSDFLDRARKVERTDPTAMSLATADAGGRPAVRMLLLKGVDDRGFLFFTNYGSRKATDLAENPRAALCLHWPVLAVQVRAEGSVQRLTREESAAYFATRPRGSQLAAWSSRQSQPLETRDALLARYRELEARHEGQPVPCPPFWGGYRLIPDQIEFWQGYEHRLHDRTLYRRTPQGWTAGHLYP